MSELDVDDDHSASFIRNLGRLRSASKFHMRMASEAMAAGVAGVVLVRIPSRVDSENPVDIEFHPGDNVVMKRA